MKNILIGLFLFVSSSAYAHKDAAPPNCSDARNQQVVQHLSRGQKFDEVVTYLEGADVPYFLSSRKGQTVSLKLIREKGYSAFGPIEIIIRSDDGGGVMSMAAVTEMLIIDFDKQAVLAKDYCITYKTGA